MERERRSRRHVLATVGATVALSARGGGSDGDDGVTDELHELRYDERGRVLTVGGTRIDGTGGFVDDWTSEDGPCTRAGRNSADRYLCVDARETD